MKKQIRNDEERKKVILKILKKYGRLSATKLCFLGFGHLQYTILIPSLEKLVKEQKIVQEPETNATYWKLKE